MYEVAAKAFLYSPTVWTMCAVAWYLKSRRQLVPWHKLDGDWFTILLGISVFGFVLVVWARNFQPVFGLDWIKEGGLFPVVVWWCITVIVCFLPKSTPSPLRGTDNSQRRLK
jgi:hypothetical protein